MKLFNQLPSIYQNDINLSLYENVIDKFLSKYTMVNIDGVIGETDDPAKIPEFTDFRTNNQLQPQMYSNIGSEHQLTSFEDFLEVVKLWGVDVDKFNEWGTQSQFSLHPPFDLHKFNNFNEYYWVATTPPDYITIKNRYLQLTYYVFNMFKQYPTLQAAVELAYQTGDQSDIDAVNAILPGFYNLYVEYMLYLTNDPANIINEGGWDNVEWDATVNGNWDEVVDGLQYDTYTATTITMPGNTVSVFTLNLPFTFQLIESGANNGFYTSFNAVYDLVNNVTVIDVSPSLTLGEPAGKVKVGNFDGIEWDPLPTEGGWDRNSDNANIRDPRLQYDDWSQNNKWVHVSNIPQTVNLSQYHRGEIPIIEFDPYVELNEWVEINRLWKYGIGNDVFDQSNITPTDQEILAYRDTEHPVSLAGNYVTVSASLGQKIKDNQQLTIELIVANSFIYPTIVNWVDNGSTYTFLTNYVFTSVNPLEVNVHSLRRTSVGDDWRGFTEHWELQNDFEYVPTYNREDVSQYVSIPVQGVNSTVYDLGITFKSNVDELRVYVNNRRQYGNYVEGNFDGVTFTQSYVPEDCNAIMFDSGLGGGTIRVHYGNQVLEDSDKLNVPVRLQDNGVIEIHLLSCVKYEQQKVLLGQYPLFNRYDHNELHTNTTTKVWNYVRINTAAVNELVNDRVELQFLNDLVDVDAVKTYVKKRENYDSVPEFVGAWRYVEDVIPVKVGEDWDLPSMFKYNPTHTDRQDYLFTYTVSHFKQIIESQTSDWVNVMNPINAAGFIREHNHNVDWLWSHIHCDLPSFIEIIKYGRDAYSRSIQYFKQKAQELLPLYVNDLSGLYVAVKTAYETDNNLVQFNDSTCVIKNFPMTPVTFQWAPRSIPSSIVVDGKSLITHHDGHVSSIKLNEYESSQIQQQMQLAGIIKLSALPSLVDIVLNQVVIVSNKYYRVKPFALSNVDPTSNLNLNEVWYNTATDTTFIGTQTGNVIVGNNQAWTELDVSQIVADVIVSMEMELYGMGVDSVPDYVVPTDMLAELNNFIKTSKLDINVTSDYDINNPFTWNYSTVYPQTPRWYTIYETLFGTRFPNLEPWKVQGYSVKPLWWDSEYKDYTGNRLWLPIMWLNIRNGHVPSGYAYPSGAISTGNVSENLPPVPVIPVNTTNSNSEFGYDQLLPPYFWTASPSFASVCRLVSINIPPSQASVPYSYGERGPLEDIWMRSIYYVYDVITSMWKNDPITLTAKWLGLQTVTTDSKLKVHADGRITPYYELNLHGDVDQNQNVTLYNGLYQWMAHLLRYRTFDYDLVGYRAKRDDSVIKFSYPVSGFIDQTTIAVLKRTNLYYNSTISYDVILKKSVNSDTIPLTALRCNISTAGTSTIRNGLRVPVGKGSDWIYSIYAMNPNMVEMQLYKPSTEVESTFNTVVDGVTLTWNVLGTTTDIITYKLGTPLSDCDPLFVGVEGVIAFINSYEKFLIDSGYVFDSSVEATNQGDSWGINVYNFVNSVYLGMGSTSVTPFLGVWSHITPVIGTNTLNILSGSHKFKIGQQVQFYSSGKLPTPLDYNSIYVISAITPTTVDVIDLNGQPVIMSNQGQGFTSVGIHRIEVSTPASFFEFNPFKQMIKYVHPLGILSKLGNGDSIEHTRVFDQYGDLLSPIAINVMRTDDVSTLKIKPDVVNVKMNSVSTLGSFEPNLNVWEHVILFDNVSVDGDIWFDQSLGSFTKQLGLSGKIHRDGGSMKPTVGGAFFSQGNLITNVTASAVSHAEMYDGNTTVDENVTTHARKLIDFEGLSYMTDMGISNDTQLSFYQQMIQSKGLEENVTNFVNSRFFLDAKVDEWWAYKVGSYGTSNREVYQEISLNGSTRYGDIAIVNVSDTLDNPLFGSDNYRQHFSVNSKLYAKHEVQGNIEYFNVGIQYDSVDVFFNVPTLNFSSTYTGNNTFILYPYSFNADHYTPVVKFNGVVQTAQLVNNQVTVDEFVDNSGNTIVPNNGDEVSVKLVGKQLVNGTDYVTYNGTGSVVALNGMFVTGVTIFVRSVDSSLSPIQIAKYETNLIRDRIELWDPVIGIHNTRVLESVDYDTEYDLANYISSVKASEVNEDLNWGPQHVGKVWWDMYKVHYKPYHEGRLYEGDSRIRAWGELCDFASIDLYEWVESSVEPLSYADVMKADGKVASPKTRVKYRTRTNSGDSFGAWELDEILIHEFNGYEYNHLLIQNPVMECAPGDVVVYINGVEYSRITYNTVHDLDVTTLNLTVNDWDSVHVVKVPYEPSDSDLRFNPDVRDDGRLVEYKLDVPYSVRYELNDYGNMIPTFYFWAKRTDTVHTGKTLTSMASDLTNHNYKFAFMSDHVGDTYNTITLIGVKQTSEDVCMRLVNRNVLEDTAPQEYADWKLIRKGQQTNVPRMLWDKMVEALVGFTLINSLEVTDYVVPSLDLQLYDTQYGTTLRYGLGSKQAFAPADEIKTIIESVILDAEIDLYPVDRDVFRSQYNMDTVDNTVEMMDVIYKTFTPQAVNSIWFNALYAGLSANSLYEGIIKTSYIQLTSIQAILDLG